MRAPIFSQSKICLHKMAHSKGHFYSVQTPVARNFARFRGVRLFFSNTVFLKSLKTRLYWKIRLVKKISLSKIHLSGFFKKRISFGRKIYSKIQCQGCCEGKTELGGWNKTQNKTARYVFTVLWCVLEFSTLIKIYIFSFLHFLSVNWSNSFKNDSLWWLVNKRLFTYFVR